MSSKDVQKFFDEKASAWEENIPLISVTRAKEVINSLDLGGVKHILDVGCGTGILWEPLLQNTRKDTRIFAIDISLRMLLFARNRLSPRITLLQADALHLPFPDGYFQWLFCYNTFPHFEDPALVLSEFARVMTPAGRVLIFHSKSKEEIDAFHKAVGSTVKDHALPTKECMANISKASGLEIQRLHEGHPGYLFLAEKTC
ncbi:MAG TPA: methyltransferase domain-containing protein [Candidatus Hydrogenedentes bacterium]|nr:methyltransferase domain-containing protein [Candidatus Hydrogenedentota bacterium]HOL75489.1 methyltransferase domain-containing protein [Candidatus Hydrogenedentota bacterium]HPO86069.1 methyltransferase domain-containing protein [Candidatus Hydrogenedentota bacterium]